MAYRQKVVRILEEPGKAHVLLGPVHCGKYTQKPEQYG
jgi:hypothetical protein